MKTAAVIAACLTTFVLLGAQSHRDMFSKYKPLEAYEVHPTIMAVPRYAADGQVCEVGLQRMLYSPDRINLDPNLSGEEINGIVDDLAPNEERGPKVGSPGVKIELSGNTAVGTVSYANIDVETFRDASWENSKDNSRHVSVRDIRVAIIHWKNRKCQ
jgi:hypothetical protein